MAPWESTWGFSASTTYQHVVSEHDNQSLTLLLSCVQLVQAGIVSGAVYGACKLLKDVPVQVSKT
jgi:hypothetical protein